MGLTMSSRTGWVLAILLLACCAAQIRVMALGELSLASRFNENFKVYWGHQHFFQTEDGSTVQMTLTKDAGTAFKSTTKYLFGYISMRIKMIQGDSAGIVTSYYLSSETEKHDELDFEFLGNVSGEPHILQTNIFTNGVGGREQRIYLWFNPTEAFHDYSIIWNSYQIMFYVDDIPIRSYKNDENLGTGYPHKQPMYVIASLWEADDWATQGGAVKTNWTNAPFVAYYSNFKVDACRGTNSGCINGRNWWANPRHRTVSTSERGQMEWVQRNYMIYDYCTDAVRYPQSPPECSQYDIGL